MGGFRRERERDCCRYVRRLLQEVSDGVGARTVLLLGIWAGCIKISIMFSALREGVGVYLIWSA